jgi:hypothetical protein
MAKGERDGSAEVRSPYLHHNFALDGSYVHHGGVFVLPVKRWLRARNTQPARRRVQHRAHTLAGLSRAAHVMDTASALCVRFLAGGSGKRLLREREQERRRDRESEHGAERAAWGAVAKVLGGVGQHASMRHSIVYDSTVDHQVQLALDIALNPQP